MAYSEQSKKHFIDEIRYCESYFSGCLLYLQWHVLACSLKQDPFTVLLPFVYFHLCTFMARYNLV